MRDKYNISRHTIPSAAHERQALAKHFRGSRKVDGHWYKLMLDRKDWRTVRTGLRHAFVMGMQAAEYNRIREMIGEGV